MEGRGGESFEAGALKIAEHQRQLSGPIAYQEVVPTVAVEVMPGHTGAEAVEATEEEGLAVGLVEGRFGMWDLGEVNEGRKPGGGWKWTWVGRGAGGVGFVDFDQGIGGSLVEGTAAAGPADFDVEGGGGPGGKGAERLISGEVATASDHFLRLRDGPAADVDVGADTVGVGGESVEADGDAGCVTGVEINAGGILEVVQDEIQITVAIEVGEGEALGDAGGMKAPGAADFLEGAIAAVAKGEVGGFEGREAADPSEDIALGQGAVGSGGFHTIGPVGVLEIAEDAVADEEVLKTVEVHVEEDGLPGPIGGFDTGELADFGVGTIATIPLESVATDLETVDDQAGGDGSDGGAFAELHMTFAMVGAEHVGDEEVEVAVAIEVGTIDAHGRGGDGGHGVIGEGLETAVAETDPDSVWGGEIVADIEVRGAVAIEIAELDSEAPVAGGVLEG
jgi:hypothetical protein